MFSVVTDLLVVLLGYFLASYSAEPVLKLLKKLGFVQHIRQEGPKNHLIKAKTPTAAGITFLSALFVGSLLAPKLFGAAILICLCGAVGFADDYIKKVRGKNEGLKPLQKLLAQTAIAIVMVCFLERTNTNFFGTFIELGPWGFTVFVFVVLSGSMNAANLTDGVDGLANGVLGWSYVGLGLVSKILVGDDSASVMALIIGGACFGFWRLNGHPAKAFMGDTGSFLLGGGLAIIALFSRLEWLLLPLCAVSIIETLSVILQVSCSQISRRYFGSDWRPLRMAPLHHHLELIGWSEKKVVFVFGLIQALIVLSTIIAIIFVAES